MSEIKSETDYESMSIEELEQELNNIDNPERNENENKLVETEKENIEDKTQSEDKNEILENKDDIEEKKEEDDESLYNDPFYRPFKGKTKKEMLEILRNNATYVSKKDNENHQLKSELEKIKSRARETEDDDLKSYDKKDLEVIERIVERKLESDRLEKQRQKEAEIARLKQSNEEDFDTIRSNDPIFAKTIEPKLIEAIRMNAENTIQKKGWVMSFYISEKNKGVENNGKDLSKKKMNAATVTSSGSSTMPVKAEKEMSPDEWLEWALKNPEKASIMR